MEPGSLPTFSLDDIGDTENLMELSMSELISILRTAFRTSDFDRVEEVLVAKEARLKRQVEEKLREIGSLHEKLEVEKLDCMKVEEKLRKCREECEKRKKAEERYEKVLEAVNKRGLGDGSTIAELKIKNREVEDEKCRAESEVKKWKEKFKELGERVFILENNIKFRKFREIGSLNEKLEVEKLDRMKVVREIGSLNEKLEVEQLDRMKVEEQLRKCREECEKRKKAEERYEKLLEAVKKRGLGYESTIAELKIKNREVEDEKRRAESEVEKWKEKFKELGERVFLLENDIKFLMNDSRYTHVGRNTEGESGVIRRNKEVESRADPGATETGSRNADANLPFNADTRQSPSNINKVALGESDTGRLGLESIIEIEDSDNDECNVKGRLHGKEDTSPIVADSGHPSSSGAIQQKNSSTRVDDLYVNLKRKLESRCFSHGLGTIMLEDSDTDDSSSSSSGSDFNVDLLPLKSHLGTIDKRRKTEADSLGFNPF